MYTRRSEERRVGKTLAKMMKVQSICARHGPRALGCGPLFLAWFLYSGVSITCITITGFSRGSEVARSRGLYKLHYSRNATYRDLATMPKGAYGGTPVSFGGSRKPNFLLVTVFPKIPSNFA